MQTTIAQPGAQPTTATIKKPTWRESRATKKAEKAAAKLAAKALRVAAPHEMSFYERAIEWTHRADKVINLVLGYLLAIASVLGFMDVLSNGEVLSTVPFLFYVWLGIMGLGVDFQILLVIGRMPDLLSMDIEGWQKWAIGIFNAAFLIFLVVMSIVISAVFTEHRDMPVTQVVDAAHHVVSSTPTIGQAMTTLGIDDKLFVYGRAALATLLLVLMAVDRMMERWRMQITAGIQYVASVAQQIVQQVTPIAPTSAPVQASDMDKVLQAIVAMNAQNLQVMQDMNAQTIARSSQVTISLLEETVNRLTATMSLPGTQMFTQIGTPGQGKQNSLDTTTTGEVEAMASHGTSSQGKQTTNESESYKDQIEALLKVESNLNDREIVDRVGCSLRTANKWKNRVKMSA